MQSYIYALSAVHYNSGRTLETMTGISTDPFVKHWTLIVSQGT